MNLTGSYPVLLLIGLLSCAKKTGQETGTPPANRTVTTPAVVVAPAVQPAESPDAVVRTLYRVADAGKSPFQAIDSATIARYFNRDLTALIWLDIQTTNRTHEIGMLGMDPLYNAQDTAIANSRISPPVYSVPDRAAEVKMTFTNFGKAERLRYQLVKEPAGWRVSDIIYQDGSRLSQLMSGAAGSTPE